MKITLVTVGKIKEKFYTDAIAEYAKRLSRYCKLEIIQVTKRHRIKPVRQKNSRLRTKREKGFWSRSKTARL